MWFVEIGELAGMRKADIEKVKAFLSTTDDQYRAALPPVNTHNTTFSYYI
jgi:predicted P-loop ATPase